MNGTRNHTEQDIQAPSNFVSKEIVETITTTEAQRSISPIQPNFTTPNLKNTTLQQTVIRSTVKPSVAQKYSQRDYSTFRPVTKLSYKIQTSHRNNFAEHNYNNVNGPKTTKPFKTNTQNYLYLQYIRQNMPQTTSISVNFHYQPRSSQERSENYPFFQQIRNNTKKYHTRIQPHFYTTNIFPSDDDECHTQNHQRFYSNQRLRSYIFD